MDGLRSLREKNAERRIFRCVSSRSKLGVEDVDPNSEAFHASLAVLPVVDTSEECRWRREECGGMTRLEFEALQLKIAVKS